MRYLSSSLTFAGKFVFPVLVLGTASFLTLFMFLMPVLGKGGDEYYAMGSISLVPLFVLFLFHFRISIRLKSVALNNDNLVISNFRKRVVVPLSEIEDVYGTIFFMPQLVFIKFKKPTPFGRKIVFVPKAKFFSAWSEHPVAREIRVLIRKD